MQSGAVATTSVIVHLDLLDVPVSLLRTYYIKVQTAGRTSWTLHLDRKNGLWRSGDHYMISTKQKKLKILLTNTIPNKKNDSENKQKIKKRRLEEASVGNHAHHENFFLVEANEFFGEFPLNVRSQNSSLRLLEKSRQFLKRWEKWPCVALHVTSL